MKLIKPSYSILEQNSGLEGIYEQIELAGRTCYKSTPKIEEFANLDITSLPEGMSIDELPVFKEHPDEFKQKAKELNLKVDYFKVNTSAKNFVDRMIASKHYAMLEHGTVYLKVPKDKIYRDGAFLLNDPAAYTRNLYYKTYWTENHIYITTNYRYIVENKLKHWLPFLCEPTEFHEKRASVKFVTDRGVSHELVRHRVFSFAQESTRYCNYSKDKFGNELTFIIPSWMDKDERTIDTTSGFAVEPDEALFAFLGKAERYYFTLLNSGWTPQQARQVLPNALKTELVMTGFVSDWEHLFRLRTSFIAETGKPHPDMANLCDPLYKEFISKGYIK